MTTPAEPHERDVLLIGAHGGRMIPVCTDLARGCHALANRIREYERRNGRHRDDLAFPPMEPMQKILVELLALADELKERAETAGLLPHDTTAHREARLEVATARRGLFRRRPKP